MKISVLVVDDELLIRKSLGKVLRERGYTVDVASTGAEGLEKVASLRPQVMILDMRLPDTDGLTVLRGARQLDPLLQVIIITAYGDVQTAVDAMKVGACDFVRKPYELEDIVLAVQAAGRTFKQASELDLYRRQAWQHYSGEEIIGQSAPMREVRGLIDKVVRSQATSVLITGESGTGKELVARAIHYRSDRKQAPLMEVNCSSFQEQLLENELFGHEKGAFTDAQDTKKGFITRDFTDPDGAKIPYVVFVPHDYDGTKEYPVILFLHGAGETRAETDLGRVRLGQAAEVRVDSLPGAVLSGRLAFIAPDAEFTPKTVETRALRVDLVYRVKIEVANPDGALKLGMPADVRLKAAAP